MKKIVCELCEGMDFAKADGMFTCQGCGTKYTLEQAKAMMVEVEGDFTPVAATSATPAVNPNQQQLDNILILASTAYEASNYQETENYCNKAIETDATSYRAWLLKGKAVGWSSTMGNLRIEEAAHSFCKAIDFAPEDDRDAIKDEAVGEIQRLGLALVGLRKPRFIKSPKDELDGFKSDMTTIYSALNVLLKHGNSVEMSQEFMHNICSVICDAGEEGSKKADENYLAKEYPDIDDFSVYGSNLIACASVVKTSIDLNPNETDEVKLASYKIIQDIVGLPIKTEPKVRAIYQKEWNSTLSMYLHNANALLSMKAITLVVSGVTDLFGDKKLGEIVSELEEKVEAKKKEEEQRLEEERKRRIEAYWEEHSEEKLALETERKELAAKANELTSESLALGKQIQIIGNEATVSTPSEDEKKKVQQQISDLRSRKAGLGLFAGKEKKQIDEEVSILEGRLPILEKKIQEEKSDINKEIIKKKQPLIEQKKAVDSELETVKKRVVEINNRFEEDPEK